MLNTDIWQSITVLHYKSSFCEFWRDCHGDWQAKFADSPRESKLKSDSLRAALEEVQSLWLSKKYLPKPIKTVKKRKKKENVPTSADQATASKTKRSVGKRKSNVPRRKKS